MTRGTTSIDPIRDPLSRSWLRFEKANAERLAAISGGTGHVYSADAFRVTARE
jgi:hypothetical protein